MRYDTLIKGGRVVDPASGLDEVMDVATVKDRIAALDRDIPVETALRVVDATNQYVTPGLIDAHTHIYPGVTYWGVPVNSIASHTGVTTWIDAGSAGAYTLLGFRDHIARAACVRVYAFLNISSIGLTAPNYELATLDFCDSDLCTMMVNLHRDLVLGVKVRMGTPMVGVHGIEPLRRARRVADACGRPLMVHISRKPPEVDEILSFLKSGDILTHCCTNLSMKLLDDEGHVLESARRAKDLGVVFDVGHGSGSFSFDVAEALIEAGMLPDIISTDIHQISMNGPLYDMPTCLSKFLALGLSFSEVIRAATYHPAQLLGLDQEIGTLRIGSSADIALFRLEHGNFPFYDVHMNLRYGQQLLCNTLTICAGHPLPALPREPSAPWIRLTREQRELQLRGHTPSQLVG